MKAESRITRRARIVVTLGMLVVFTGFMEAALVRADDVTCGKRAPATSAPCGVGTCTMCCPDVYVPKPVPCVSRDASCCADMYCPKPCLVLPFPTTCCCPDDYCAKPRPTLCRPMANAWYKCVPAFSSPGLPRATCNPAANPRARLADDKCPSA